jgi:trans-aconitate methyltransferase
MKQDNKDLTKYYAARAAEYEAIYAKPERQADLQAAAQILQDIFQAKIVLEIACGTGYWTQIIAQTASQIQATDINESVLEIARSKVYPHEHVQFSQVDLYEIQPNTSTEALFAGFIWSHIKLEALDRFADKLNSLVGPGGTVVIMDNRFIAGSSTPISEQDAQGNTYQRRLLKDGSTFLVLKNFPERHALAAALSGKSQNFQYIELPHFWICVYQTISKDLAP